VSGGRLQLALALACTLVGLSVAPAVASEERSAKAPKCVKWAKRHGKRVCVKRALPPPARPLAGRYSGTTSQGSRFFFTVVRQGAATSIEDPYFDELDESCEPSAHLTFTSVGLTGRIPLDAKGRFAAELHGTRDDESSYAFTLKGTLDLHGHGAGTFVERETFLSEGASYDCSTGQQTWTATAS
jgi:hypothetical protein